MKTNFLAAYFLCIVGCSSASAQVVTDEKALPYIQKATLLMREGQSDQARAGFEKCLEFSLSAKHESMVRACLANLYHQTDYDKAFEYVKRAYELDPTNYNVLPTLGSAYAQKREYSAARKCLEEYLKVNPDGAAAANVKGLLAHIDRLEQRGVLLAKINKAVTAYNETNYELAIAVLEETQKEGTHAHKDKEQEILGMSYLRVGKYRAAADCFNGLLASDPKQPLIVSALAGAYEGMGDLKKARECLKKYVQLDGKGEMAVAAKDRMPVLKKVMKSAGDNDSADYFQAVSKPRIHRWSLTRMPLRVFFEPGDSVKNYQNVFADSVPRSLDLWCRATDGKLSWTKTANRADANMEVLFTADPASISRTHSHQEAGICELKASGQKGVKVAGIDHVVIKLLTTNDDGKAYNAAEIEAAAAHEVGHALGMNGHSANPDDVMFFAASKNIREGLSARDAATIKCVYDAVVYDDGRIEVPGR